MVNGRCVGGKRGYLEFRRMRRDWRRAGDARHHAGGIDGNRRRRQDEVNHAGHVAGGPMVATRHGRAGDRATGMGRHGTVLHAPAANRHAAVAAHPAQERHHQQDQHQGLAPAIWTGRDQMRGTTEMRFTKRRPRYSFSFPFIFSASRGRVRTIFRRDHVDYVAAALHRGGIPSRQRNAAWRRASTPGHYTLWWPSNEGTLGWRAADLSCEACRYWVRRRRAFWWETMCG